jgi:hypothetical protein
MAALLENLGSLGRESLNTLAVTSGIGILGGSPLGSFGQLVFECSQVKVQNWGEFQRHAEYAFADHEVLGGKPVSEWTGPGLDELQIEMTFNASLLNGDPVAAVEQLRTMAGSGTAQALVLVGQSLGNYTIRSIEDQWLYVRRNGPEIVTVSVTLREYVESVITTAQAKQRDDELHRSDSGVGGPARLPGAPNPLQPRNLSPDIDPATRLPKNDDGSPDLDLNDNPDNDFGAGDGSGDSSGGG